MIAIAVFLQCLEILWLDKKLKVWPAPSFLFKVLVILALISSVTYLFSPDWFCIFFMLLGTVAVSWRFRGTFNGGADYMTVVVLTGLLLPKPLGHYYIAIQLILSYLIAGLVKLKSPDWRNGLVLKKILSESNYLVPPWAKTWIQKSKVSLVFTWALLVFECSFILSLLSPSLFWTYAGFALVFHLGNFLIFGLNRFFFAWAAAYPSLYWLVTFLA